MRRQTLLAATSLSLVAIAGTAVLTAAATANAQSVPVTFGTDPTGAHPRYAQDATYEVERAPQKIAVAATGAPAALSFEVAAAPTSASASEVRTVTVAPGDTVYGLARRHGVGPTEIIAANGLTAPYALSLGQTLRLPGEAVAATGASDPIVAAAVTQPRQAAAPSVGSSLLKKIERVADAKQSGAVTPVSASSVRHDAVYSVRKGDTLYSLSRRFEVPLEALASANNLVAPFGLSLGQDIVIPKVVPTLETPTEIAAAPVSPEAAAPLQTGGAFAWPIRGAIVAGYGSLVDGVENAGINIAAPAGAPVRASADGEVVYKGDELAGYGNLLLVKHDGGWVSAYAHTGTILVDKGERVSKGQVVAKVGDTGSVTAPQLHFELRHDLRPQDPIAALNGTLTNASFRR